MLSASMIRQFDVFPNPLRDDRKEKPFVVNVQHYLLDHLATRITGPLIVRRSVHEPSRIYPQVTVAEDILYFDPTDLVPMPLRFLKNPIANLEAESFRIIAALDLVFTGV
jgi:toxin CcdB